MLLIGLNYFRFLRKRVGTVKSKLRKFLREGGKWMGIIELSNTEIVTIYKTLFFKRHGKLPLGIENFDTVLSHLRDCLFGNVLFFDEKPISIQIIYRNISKRKMSFEFVNGAFDPNYKRYAPGSLLIFKNTTEAEKLAKEADLECYYTFAKYDADYKAKWCEISSIFQTTIK
ncbi:MAG: hypothetical protein DRR19_00180 [Candidatus Parabeggiatoa sp. nov. 1]|nr:MAG: hypothetical protein DRR19_00180 [Gammaproteobacteria bacterium]